MKTISKDAYTESIIKLVCVCFLGGCATHAINNKGIPTEQVINNKNYPEEWGGLSHETFSKSNECPAIAGRYDINSKSIESIQYLLSDDKYSENSYLNSYTDLLAHPRFGTKNTGSIYKRYTDPELASTLYGKEIIITQDNDSYIVTYAYNENNIKNIFFSYNAGDYICKKGWLILKTTTGDGSSEGSAYTIIVKRRRAKLASGALIYQNYTKTTKTSLLFFGSSIVSNRYTKFERIARD